MNDIIIPTRSEFLLLEAPRQILRHIMPVVTARLAVTGPLRLIDAGNCFNLYQFARSIRLLTPDVEQCLQQIKISRAFTCYQVLTLLSEAISTEAPLVVLEPLTTFYDENLAHSERERLLLQSITELKRLSQSAPLAVSISHPRLVRYVRWRSLFEAAASQVWRAQEHPKHKLIQLL